MKGTVAEGQVLKATVHEIRNALNNAKVNINVTALVGPTISIRDQFFHDNDLFNTKTKRISFLRPH
jgi:hypothetical protein